MCVCVCVAWLEAKEMPRQVVRNAALLIMSKVPKLGNSGSSTSPTERGQKAPVFCSGILGQQTRFYSFVQTARLGKIPPPPVLSLADLAITNQSERSDRRGPGLHPPKCYFGKDVVIRWASELLSGRWEKKCAATR